MEPPLRLGILGASRIAPKALIEPAEALEHAEVIAVAARDPERALRFAERHHIPSISESYPALLGRDDVDAVYNGLPNSLHAPLSLAALDAGKHVLCEKPVACNASEARQLVSRADACGLVLFEAFHYRYHPLVTRIAALAEELGGIERMDAHFHIAIPSSNIRYDLALGGGATMDLGCYTIHLLRTLAGEEPERLSARAVEGPPGIDVEMRAELEFPSGCIGAFHCAMSEGTRYEMTLELVARRGRISASNVFAPQFGHTLVCEPEGKGPRDEAVARLPGTYTHQLEAFVHAVRDGEAPLTAGRDVIAQMEAIDSVYRAAGLPVRGAGS